MDARSQDEAVATPSPPLAVPPKPKRPERERKKVVRFQLLHSMTVEQRRQYLIDEEAQVIAIAKKMRRTMSNGSGAQRIAIDLGFDAIMNDKEINSLAKQLKLSYGVVKRMETPFQLHFLHCSATLWQSLMRFDADKWLVHWHVSNNSTGSDTGDGHNANDHHHVNEIAGSPADIVYLSPDSPNVLMTLDCTKTYLIGGIVDKSRKKGATLNAASSVGVTTARLPIQEFITERLDHILNVNTVIEVLIGFQETGGDWERALRQALPQRKQSQAGRRSRKRQAALALEEEQLANQSERTGNENTDERESDNSSDAISPLSAAHSDEVKSDDLESGVKRIVQTLSSEC